MPQGAIKKAGHKSEKIERNPQHYDKPSKHWKKKRDPVRAALIKKVEACAMEKALKAPLKGGMKVVKATEEKAKMAQKSTKEVMKNAAAAGK